LVFPVLAIAFAFEEATLGEPGLSSAPGHSQPFRCNYRDSADDFFCLRYQVWYPSLDCAFRTHFKTCAGCLNCEQGRFNLKRHRAAVSNLRFGLNPGD
jgi:hypothetical protein